MRTLTSLVLAPLAIVAGCNAGPEPKYGAAKNDGVPANSASEERLAGGKKEEPKQAAHDPTQPYTQPVSGSDQATPGGPKETGGTPPKKGGKEKPTTATAAGGAGSKDKVSKAECSRALDRGIDLMIGTDARFEGIPPEMIAQFKQQGFSQAGMPNPCNGDGMTKGQYDCAMGAASSKAWERCLK